MRTYTITVQMSDPMWDDVKGVESYIKDAARELHAAVDQTVRNLVKVEQEPGEPLGQPERLSVHNTLSA